MTSDLLQYWPMADSPPRKTQMEVFDWIETLPSHIKYILCEIPVGGGKSPLALNLSGYYSKTIGDSYILTPQKILQKQYENSFDEKYIHSLYGKANYTCVSKKTNCDIGSDIKPQCPQCPFKESFLGCRSASNVVLNYTLGLMLFKYVADGEIIRKRKFCVFDEAHTLENHLTEFNAISISETRCKKLKVKFINHKNMGDAIRWIKDTYIAPLRRKVAELNELATQINNAYEQDDCAPTRDEQNIISEAKEFKDHLAMIVDQLLCVDFADLVERFVLVNDTQTSFKFKELYGKKIFADFVEPMAEKFLFMSSTILDKDEFCRDLGLDPAQAAFISVGSEFEPDNRPVMFTPSMRMNYGWQDDNRTQERKKMIRDMLKIISIHEGESGIIHTGNFQIAKWLVSELTDKVPHKIMHHNPESGMKRDAVIAAFQELDGVPKILISPSITEGLDLKDDLGRFAMFAKVPYPFLGDAWVKKRMALSERWYMRQALIAMIQGGGRVVRSKDDWGHVYILDASFGQLYKRSYSMVPQWWRDGYSEL